MKNKILFKILLFSLITCFTSLKSQAGTVAIDTAYTSYTANSPCNFTQRIFFIVSGTALGYPANDTVNVKIAFGDGTSVNSDVIIDTNSNYYWSTVKTYNFSGQFTASFIVTGSDMAADTIVIPNAVVFPDTCGNIQGKIYSDLNSNCVVDPGDMGISGIRVNAYQGNVLVASDWTDTSGIYYLEVATGQTYVVTTENTNGYSTICPATDSITVTTIPSNGNDFAMVCTPGFDLYGHASGGSVPGQNLNMWVYGFNSFCENKSGTVKLIFDDPLFSYAGNAVIPPTSVNGDTVEWAFSNINNGWGNNFNTRFMVYTDTTAQIGDTVCVTYIIDPISGDADSSNNVKRICIPVRTSYDPNIKLVNPLGVSDSGKVLPNTDLTYTIHFQNTGTAQAYNIYILDTIDVTTLDLSSIEILGASHDFSSALISTNQNVLKFRFDDIMLADSTSNEPESHGWVTYKIKQQPNLVNGTVIRNLAAIYFDYNPPVITPYTFNTIDNLLVGIQEIKEAKNNFATIYPNPANDFLQVQIDANTSSSTLLRIFDITGKTIRETTIIQSNSQVPVSDLKPGIYFIELINTNSERQINKLIISR